VTDEAAGMRAAYARFEARVAGAMTAADPVAVIRALADDASLPGELRQAARAAVTHARGIELTALLVARLRFERLMQGSREASALFERDPVGFAELFRSYHREVAPGAFFPAQERRLFAAWLAARPPPVPSAPR
jgi:hypothetical protein